MRRLLGLSILVFALVGCSGDGQLTKKQDDELRHNFTRKLTPEEIARMGGGPPAGAPDKGK